jgi:hypothetical protein
MRELLRRLMAKTPSFFIRLRNRCSIITIASVGANQYAYMLPPLAVKLLGIAATAGVVGAFISQCVVEDPNDLKPKTDDTKL